MFVSDDLRIITFQFHPEYSEEYIKWLEKRWDKKAGIERKLEQHSPDLEHHHSLKMIRNSIR